MSEVKVRRVLSAHEDPAQRAHDDQKWFVIEGYIEGKPALTKRVTISTAALADGSITIEAQVEKLIADVEEYETRLEALAAVDLDTVVARIRARKP